MFKSYKNVSRNPEEGAICKNRLPSTKSSSICGERVMTRASVPRRIISFSLVLALMLSTLAFSPHVSAADDYTISYFDDSSGTETEFTSWAEDYKESVKNSFTDVDTSVDLPQAANVNKPENQTLGGWRTEDGQPVKSGQTGENLAKFADEETKILKLCAIWSPTTTWGDTDTSDPTKYVNADFSWYDDPSKTDFTISTAAQLAGLAVLVNNAGVKDGDGNPVKVKDKNDKEATGTDFAGKKIKLELPDGTDSLDLSAHQWVPIGLGNELDDDDVSKNVFKGSFDGNNKEIRNMKIGAGPDVPADYQCAGLFGVIISDETSGEIKIENVGIGECSHVYSTGSAGGILAYAFADASITIENCYNKGTISAASYDYAAAAGILAKADAYASITIENCYNTGNISADASADASAAAAGILARAYAAASITIENCYNTGNISASSSSAYAAGILAKAYAFASITIIENCYNTGNISANADAKAKAAGICAYAYAFTSITIENCYNKGTISADADADAKAYAAGICAYAFASITIENCYNKGNISAYAAGIFAYADAGGICAYAYASSAAGATARARNITITNCSNSGTISSASAAASDAYAGGILAYADADASSSASATATAGNITITNCSNSGTISSSAAAASSASAGGILAYAYADDSAFVTATAGDITITNCYNTGNISAAYDAAGICAKADASSASASITIENCYNTGNISAYAYAASAAGICAYADADDSAFVTATAGDITITNCYNTGNISAAYDAAGICAKADASSASASITIENCYNTGNISAYAYAADAAGICAKADADELIANIKINNCYHVGNITGTTVGAILAKTFDRTDKIAMSNTYYLTGIAGLGSGINVTDQIVGNQPTALSEAQMKAAAGAAAGEGWQEITVTKFTYAEDNNPTGTEALTDFTSKQISLVDALNAGADAYNSTEPEPEITALNWENGHLGYPVFKDQGIIYKNSNVDKTYFTDWAEGYAPPIGYISGLVLTLPTAANVQKEGYTFAGWYDNPEFTGNKVTEIEKGTSGTQTFYAKWENKLSGWVEGEYAEGETPVWYYYKNGEKVSGWQDIEIKVPGQTEETQRYYFDPAKDNAMHTGWLKYEGSWYYLDVQDTEGNKYKSPSEGLGMMQRDDWDHDGGTVKYYFGPDGKMEDDWVQVNGKWYYFHENTAANEALGIVGQLATDMWEEGHDGYWYRVGPDGTELTAWQLIDNIWYYLGIDGKMATGWNLIGNHWYYFYEDEPYDGEMAVNTVIDGYYIGADGKSDRPID